jgi:hypothetical protein
LREALAGTNHDFLLRDGKPANATRNAQRRKNMTAFLRMPFRTRPQARTIVLIGFAAIALIGVPLNALFLQDGRHPAPLFGASAPQPPKIAERAPLPPPRPASGAASTKIPSGDADVAKSDDAPPDGAGRPAEKTRDPIGLLLASGVRKSEEFDKKTQLAQRALVKLGYVLRADGKFGGATRQALEKFERDSGLPVKGELTPKILRRLSASSGVALE